MLDPIECAKGKLNEREVMRWALGRYEQVARRAVLPPFGRDLVPTWHCRWPQGGDGDILEDAFRVLASRQLANLRPTIGKRWSGLRGHLGARATPIFVEGPPNAS